MEGYVAGDQPKTWRATHPSIGGRGRGEGRPGRGAAGKGGGGRRGNVRGGEWWRRRMAGGALTGGWRGERSGQRGNERGGEGRRERAGGRADGRSGGEEWVRRTRRAGGLVP